MAVLPHGADLHNGLLPEYDTDTPASDTFYATLSGLVDTGVILDTAPLPTSIKTDTVTGEVIVSFKYATQTVAEWLDANVPEESVLTTQTPGTTGATDGSVLELGMRFNVAVPGTITAIRYWKDVADTDVALSTNAPHTGTIWDADGNVLATVEFADETASGWQEQALDTPLAVVTETNYVVSVESKNFVLTSHGFDSEIVNGNVTGVQGLFAAVGVFPDGVFNNTNYFRDIVFVAD